MGKGDSGLNFLFLAEAQHLSPADHGQGVGPGRRWAACAH